MDYDNKKHYYGIKICRHCKGEGLAYRTPQEARITGKPQVYDCPYCAGTGRVRYDTKVIIHEEPYAPHRYVTEL